MLATLTVKPLLFTCAILLASTASFGYLSYTFYGDKKEAELALSNAVNANLSLQNSLEKQKQACVIDIKSTLEFQEDKKELEKNKEEVIQGIEKLASTIEETSDEKSVVNIDAPLPPSLRSLLDKAYDNSKRPTAPNP